RIHDLRHSFASIGVSAGHGLPIVGKLLGHADASSTARYAHLDADPVRRVSNSIAATIAAAMSGKNCEVASTADSDEAARLKRDDRAQGFLDDAAPL
ncbi:MAG TPA: tyrosine-type recombinase/integrase, partial [Xanthobacteraceae bacterium]|nr:tyrosine-type recombinase/integrase [Xanthobacteraceae bacterium]